MKKHLKIFIPAVLLVFASPKLHLAQSPDTLSTQNIVREDIVRHISALSSDKLKGRKAGSEGEKIAAAYISSEFERYGLVPAGDSSGYMQNFTYHSGIIALPGNILMINDEENESRFALNKDYVPLGISSNRAVTGNVVFAGFGAANSVYNDYENINVDDKIALIITNDPEGENPITVYGDNSMYGKAVRARDNGAAGLLIYYGFKSEQEDKLPPLTYNEFSVKLGIPVLHIRRNVVMKLFEDTNWSPLELENKIIRDNKPYSVELPGKIVTMEAEITTPKTISQNVVGLIRGRHNLLSQQYFIIGAHYDHLGEEGSRLFDFTSDRIFNGADDNASGVAALLELAEKFSGPNMPNHSLLFIALGASEDGNAGSKYYMQNKVASSPATQIMINLDAIGRIQDNKVFVNANGSFASWYELADRVNTKYGFDIIFDDSRIGGSDHKIFFVDRIPVVAISTGFHNDFHKVTDEADIILLDETTAIANFAYDIINTLDRDPDYYKLSDKSALLAGGSEVESVKEGGIAEIAGLREGDLIVRMRGETIKSEFDYNVVWSMIQPGENVEFVVLREGKMLKFTVRLPKK